MKQPSKEAIEVARDIELCRSIARFCAKVIHSAMNAKGQISFHTLLLCEAKCLEISDITRKLLKRKEIWGLRSLTELSHNESVAIATRKGNRK